MRRRTAATSAETFSRFCAIAEAHADAIAAEIDRPDPEQVRATFAALAIAAAIANPPELPQLRATIQRAHSAIHAADELRRAALAGKVTVH